MKVFPYPNYKSEIPNFFFVFEDTLGSAWELLWW